MRATKNERLARARLRQTATVGEAHKREARKDALIRTFYFIVFACKRSTIFVAGRK